MNSLRLVHQFRGRVDFVQNAADSEGAGPCEEAVWIQQQQSTGPAFQMACAGAVVAVTLAGYHMLRLAGG